MDHTFSQRTDRFDSYTVAYIQTFVCLGRGRHEQEDEGGGGREGEETGLQQGKEGEGEAVLGISWRGYVVNMAPPIHNLRLTYQACDNTLLTMVIDLRQ